MTSPNGTPSYPVAMNARLTIEQHAAVVSIAETEGVSQSEALRVLLDLGMRDLKKRIGQALQSELPEGQRSDDDARALGDSVRFIAPPAPAGGEPEW